ncbi:MAG: FAD-binding protein [Deltaproteobacteria bacterium]|nr:FAD-binding protein [Deltaproteobacteria bacterium]
MGTDDQKALFDCNRRDFLKASAGVCVAALTIPGISLISNADAASATSVSQEIIETDVLVIGGGFAGTFAAMKAKDKGVDVILADKGYVGRSGSSPWAGAFSTFDPAGSSTLDTYINNATRQDEYIFRRDYVEMWVKDSEAIGKDVVAWGTVGALNHGDVFREQLRKSNIRLIERIMITNLLEKKGQVVGAIGFPMEEDKAIIIKAKAVVLCTGAGGFKNVGFPIGPLTYDGQAMAYRLGAEISGKEWNDGHMIPAEHVDSVWYQYQHHFNMKFGGGPGGKGKGSKGGKGSKAGKQQAGKGKGSGKGGPGGGARLSAQAIIFEAHKGNVPVLVKDILGEGVTPRGPNPLYPDTSLVLGSTAGEAPHRHDGLFPKDDRCASNVPGLFAAGDALCTAGVGGSGISSSGSAVQGANAGISAAEFSMRSKVPEISRAEIIEVKKQVFEPRAREKGYSPAWITQVIQSIMTPYYVLYVKKKERLEAALINIEFLRDHFAPKLLANNTHELRLAHETRNMILNAEMKLRASLFRTESRATHYREDFPARNDDEWLAWVIIKQEAEKMELNKKQLPDDWKPDSGIPYEQRYRNRFPGELEYLTNSGKA